MTVVELHRIKELLSEYDHRLMEDTISTVRVYQYLLVYKRSYSIEVSNAKDTDHVSSTNFPDWVWAIDVTGAPTHTSAVDFEDKLVEMVEILMKLT